MVSDPKTNYIICIKKMIGKGKGFSIYVLLGTQ